MNDINNNIDLEWYKKNYHTFISKGSEKATYYYMKLLKKEVPFIKEDIFEYFITPGYSDYNIKKLDIDKITNYGVLCLLYSNNVTINVGKKTIYDEKLLNKLLSSELLNYSVKDYIKDALLILSNNIRVIESHFRDDAELINNNHLINLYNYFNSENNENVRNNIPVKDYVKFVNNFINLINKFENDEKYFYQIKEDIEWILINKNLKSKFSGTVLNAIYKNFNNNDIIIKKYFPKSEDSIQIEYEKEIIFTEYFYKIKFKPIYEYLTVKNNLLYCTEFMKILHLGIDLLSTNDNKFLCGANFVIDDIVKNIKNIKNVSEDLYVKIKVTSQGTEDKEKILKQIESIIKFIKSNAPDTLNKVTENEIINFINILNEKELLIKEMKNESEIKKITKKL